MGWLALGVLWTATAIMLVAAWTDWHRREIPHWTLLVLVAGWTLVAVALPQGLGGTIAAGLVCGAAGLAVGVALYSFGLLGGGDGKLLAVLGLWLGVPDFGFALLAGAGLLALFLVVARADAGHSFRRRGIPCACALAPPGAVLLAARAVGLSG
ncbi:MAG: hypothetical protein F4169_00065 [Gammaproteobacteria bacterium]|nr:hypothetical protein [Gammaproteobacteria bacterium]